MKKCLRLEQKGSCLEVAGLLDNGKMHLSTATKIAEMAQKGPVLVRGFDDLEKATAVNCEVVISKEAYDALIRSDIVLGAMQRNGVDNWDWYGEAMEDAEADLKASGLQTDD